MASGLINDRSASIVLYSITDLPHPPSHNIPLNIPSGSDGLQTRSSEIQTRHMWAMKIEDYNRIRVEPGAIVADNCQNALDRVNHLEHGESSDNAPKLT